MIAYFLEYSTGADSGSVSGHRQAWEVGVLHRDVSAGNILISERPEKRLRGFLHDFDYSSMTKEIPPPLDDSDPRADPLLRMADACDDDDLKERTVCACFLHITSHWLMTFATGHVLLHVVRAPRGRGLHPFRPS